MIRNIIFDFDSTIINAEGIELIVESALTRAEKGERKEKLALLHEITNTVTDGKMSFSEAFKQRFALADVKIEDVTKVAANIVHSINPQVKETIKALHQHNKNIYVFSISFKELALPVTRELGISDENVFANQIELANNEQVVGVNANQALFLNTGKVYLAELLLNQNKLNGDTAIVGDGYSDLLVRKNNIAQIFVYFSGTHIRPQVQIEADFIIDRFDQLLPLFCSNEELSNETAMALGSSNKEPQNSELPPKTILLENIHQNAVEHLIKNQLNTEAFKGAWDEEALAQNAHDANVLGIRSKTTLSVDTIKVMQNLWVVGAFCIGTNQIDLEAATRAGIPVFNAPYSNTRSVAELVVGETIMLMRNIPAKNSAAHKGTWLKGAFGSSEIRGKTIGIIGYGHIGSQVSIMLENLGMSIIFHDIVDKLPLGNASRAANLNDLLQRADIVTLHVPDTEQTKKMMGKKELAIMKRGSFLINSSRGSIVDLDALKIALEKNHIAGAALDVFPDEPATQGDRFDLALQNFDNVILTPHIGGSTEEAQINIANYVAEKLVQFVKTGSTTGSVNFPQINLPRIAGTHRILHIHHNVPGVLAKINSVFARRNINVEGQILQTRGDIGYLIVDVNSQISAQVLEIMKLLTETIKVRRIT